MRNQLYVANLAETVAEEQIQSLFEQCGGVISIEPGINEKFGTRVAIVTMESEKAANKANQQLNGYNLEGQYLSISYPDVDEAVVERGLSNKQRKTAVSVVKELGEEWRKPVRRIHTMILLCGHSFVLHLVEEAKEIDAGEGMMTYDGSRRRSVGGVFFTLANRRMAPPIYQIIHLRGGKLHDYKPADDALINHLVRNPKEF